MPDKHFYEFGPYRVDVALSRLERDGTAVPLPPKAFDLLILLARNPDRVVATTVASEEYSWQYFQKRLGLIEFAEQNLPRVGDKPKRLDDSELCNLDLLSAARCPAATARRAPGSRVP